MSGWLGRLRGWLVASAKGLLLICRRDTQKVSLPPISSQHGSSENTRAKKLSKRLTQRNLR